MIFILWMLTAYAIEQWLPSGLVIAESIKQVAVILMLIAALLLLHMLLMFKRQQTAVEPWKPTTHIITSGYYRFSRNPIYLTFCFYPVGLGCIESSWWLISSFLPACFTVYHLAIKREERYLQQKFPQDYAQYCNKVRRWI
nr:isoprenylcysteine carboxylmethyltransferase family protein [Shewanella sp. Isolate11]